MSGHYPVARGSRAHNRSRLMGVRKGHRQIKNKGWRSRAKQCINLNTAILHYLSLKSLKEQIQRPHQMEALQNSRNSKQSSLNRSTRPHRTCNPIPIWPLRPPTLNLCTRDSSKTTYCQISMPLQITSIRT